jgi:MoaA/NifB/PqqE/SkfB family radical SAM enzyme
MDVAHGETVEKQLGALIQRRARKGDVDPDEREEIWKESVCRYNARRREENRREWCGYFERLSACLRARAEEYAQRAQMLMETDQPKGAA